ncbi:DUF4406 domain-containing protein [Castellaniella sp.]|uniref:DUF4406 domain-containing protein n=1 Tax=Castellaniella sp. TaxID=1955812 RepID=UPI002AFEE727|nr:DUF4406 domain-containing protein [Castellaniella sp.]
MDMKTSLVHVSDAVYIAGPMTGRVGLNYEAFNAVAAWLRAQGREVVSPAEFGLAADTPWADCMRVAARAVSYCGEVLLLPGWEQSKGACKEADLAATFAMPTAVLDLDEIAASQRQSNGAVSMDLAVRTIATLMHAEVLAGNNVTLCGHTFHPDVGANEFWGCSPYGVDFVVSLASACPGLDVLAGYVPRLIRGEICGGVPPYCEAPEHEGELK